LLLKKEDHILDYNSERAETFYGSENTSYSVSKTADGTLKITLDHSNKKFYRLSTAILLLGTAGLTAFCLNEKLLKYFGFFTMFIILFSLIFLGWLAVKIVFRMLQRVAWHFTNTELIIYCDVYFQKKFRAIRSPEFMSTK
jgi:hypothetical protein